MIELTRYSLCSYTNVGAQRSTRICKNGFIYYRQPSILYIQSKMDEGMMNGVALTRLVRTAQHEERWYKYMDIIYIYIYANIGSIRYIYIRSIDRMDEGMMNGVALTRLVRTAQHEERWYKYMDIIYIYIYIYRVNPIYINYIYRSNKRRDDEWRRAD